ncbi:L-isoaspartate O-methyltransferase [Protomyces lactucae-debilis]|uniref:protein-L-isoaspartate(D-aspartate) O-methyltransferase n=1 Tax=Protomyces lactucae-debilis TaxID=2754530 RepID=A0A1Y2F7M9_PROLT|nr:L-isoaspartate O-methyltransferase [Protomyces lactucae-debilis]ORY79484.1 L-isoaspartate O-methyltransferase [Protomyces lactucae-debilis]
MAWRSSGRTQAELVINLQANNILKSRALARCLVETDRQLYVSSGCDPYKDAPMPIDGTSATISAPHMHAHALELLNLDDLVHAGAGANGNSGVHILDVGCGSGYLLAALHRYLQATLPATRAEQSVVVGIDHIPELISLARRNLIADGLGDALFRGRIILETGDGRLGSQRHAPFNAVHVGAAAVDAVPPALQEQLRAPGRMVLPIGPQYGDQAMTVVDKGGDGTVTLTKRFGVRYVPLC